MASDSSLIMSPEEFAARGRMSASQRQIHDLTETVQRLQAALFTLVAMSGGQVYVPQAYVAAVASKGRVHVRRSRSTGDLFFEVEWPDGKPDWVPQREAPGEQTLAPTATAYPTTAEG